jgi:hypothetical protein
MDFVLFQTALIATELHSLPVAGITHDPLNFAYMAASRSDSVAKIGAGARLVQMVSSVAVRVLVLSDNVIAYWVSAASIVRQIHAAKQEWTQAQYV